MSIPLDRENNYIFTPQHSVKNAVVWGICLQGGRLSLQLLVGIILARLLPPSDYGLIAAAMVFNYIAMCVGDAGFTTALLQRKDLKPVHLSSVFFLNLFVNIVIYSFLFFSAPYIAAFYNKPELTGVIRVMLLAVPLGTWGQIISIILTKQLRQRAMALVNIVGLLLAASVAIYMAYCGYGVWALVAQTLLSVVITSVFLLAICFWTPSLCFSVSAVKELFSFGSKMMLTSLMNVMVDNIYNVVIGKSFNFKELGFYSKASSFCNLAPTSIGRMIDSVMFPVLVSVRDDKVKVCHYFERILVLCLGVIFPVCCFLSVFSEPITLMLFKDKWLPMARYMSLLAFCFALVPVSNANMQLLAVYGYSGRYLKFEMLKRSLTILNVLININISVYSLVVGQLVLSILFVFISSHYTNSLIGYSMRRQLKDMGLYAILSFSSVWFGYFVYGFFKGGCPFVSLAIGFIVSVAFYSVVSFIYKNMLFSVACDIVAGFRRRSSGAKSGSVL